MSTMNVCILLGRLKDDPVVRRHSSGSEIATLVIEEIVVHRDRGSGTPIERTVHHHVRIYNQSFVNIAKAEGARGRHVEVHGSLSYGEDGMAFVAVPPNGGRVAFKSFEVREIPQEPPAVVADHEAARDLAEALTEPETASRPDLGSPLEAQASAAGTDQHQVQPQQETVPPQADASGDAPQGPAAASTAAARPPQASRPPQIGVGRPPQVGVRPAAVQPSTAPSQARPPVPARTPASTPVPPPSRPSVGGAAARPPGLSAGSPVAGMAQPRAQVPPRIGGSVTRPTLATRPPAAQPVAAVAGGGPARIGGGGIGRASVAPPAARQANDRTWRSTTIDDNDIDDSPPF